MTRSTRSSTAASKKREEVDDRLMEEGFSVVDSDKEKGKDGSSKAGEDEESQPPVENEEQENEQMNVDEEKPESCEKNVENESVADVSATPAKEDGKEDKVDDGKTEGDKTEDDKSEEAKKEEDKPEKQTETTEHQEGDTENTEKEKSEEKPGESEKEKKPKHPVVWVSNISRHVKATDLKKHFSKHGKVVTAKIVTNGRSFFGYVCLDSLEAVEVCVKNLNNSEFEGRKISVTVDKPVRDEKPLRKKGEDAPTNHKDPLTTVYDEAEKKPEEAKSEEKKKHSSSSSSKRKIDTSKMTQDELKREVALCEREIDRLRNRLIEEQARCRSEVKRSRRLERELGDADSKIRDDRKRYERDREEWSKKNRLEQLRLDAERVIIEREREEMRRAREEFERDLRRFIEDQQRASLDRPSRGVSPPHSSAKRFRSDDGPGESKAPWMSESGGSGGPRGDSQTSGRGSQFFGGGGSGGTWNGNPSSSGQWRSSMGSSGGSQPPYFSRNDSYGRSGGSFGGSGDGGFRSGPFDSSGRKF